MKKKRSESIFEFIEEYCRFFQKGVDAKTISLNTGYSRENVSRVLNQLVREGRLKKSDGRPVQYQLAEVELQSPKLENTERTDKKKSHEAIDIFSQLIGYDGSIKKQVKQAVASIMYPPNGLHTILYGPTGIGKTTFAGKMYEFAIESGKMSKETPFVVFNCADYSGNNQLLMSHLFGHVKGAFTGADNLKVGLVQQANGGILFLDEVHRLPPEGQEMLFSIIDTGEYRRLGESSNTNQTNVLLIAATTENLQENILTTFMRRIPAVIEFEPLTEKPISERMEFIHNFFEMESKKIQSPIQVSREVIKLLLTYDCPGNIGQLQNDIQIICANAFVDHILEESSQMMKVKLSHISNKYLEFLSTYSENRSDIMQYFENINQVFVYQPDQNTASSLHSLTKNNSNDNFYALLEKKSKEFFLKGLTSFEIRKNFDEQIQIFFDVSGKKQQNDDLDAVLKIVSSRTFNHVKEILDEVSEEFDFTYNQNILYGLSLHVETLITRLSNKVEPPMMAKQKKIQDEELTKIAGLIREKLELRFELEFPEQETTLIALLLSTVSTIGEQKQIGILVLMHGEMAATDLANTANQLLGVQHAVGINMPLTEDVSQTLELVSKQITKLDQGKGVCVLADMGSLVHFGEIISENVEIEIRTIPMVSTPMVIEATRKALLPEIDLNQLVESVIEESNLIGDNYDWKKEKAIKSRNLEVKDEQLINVLENTVTFLNIQLIFPILCEKIHDLAEKFSLCEYESFKVKMLFHCVCMIERTIRQEDFPYEKMITEDIRTVASTIKTEFKPIENIFGIQISKDEFYYVAEIIEVHKFHFSSKA